MCFSLILRSSCLLISFFTVFWVGAQEDQRPLVLSSISIIDDMVEKIGGDLVRTESLVSIGYDPHTYETVPGDVVMVAKADLIFVNGLTLEGWIQKLIDNSGTKAKVIAVTKGIQPIKSLTYENAYDPHAWMTAENGRIYAKNICDALIELLPEHRKHLEANYSQYAEELLNLDAYIAQAIESLPAQRRVLITSHDAFQYYGRRYGLELVSILGTSTDADVQTTDMLNVVKIINQKKLPAVFVESTINPQLMNQIAKENKVRIGGKLYSDSIGEEGSSADTYLKMLRHNTDVIVAALAVDTDGEPGMRDDMGTEDSHNAMPWIYGGLAVMMIAGSVLLFFRMSQ